MLIECCFLIPLARDTDRAEHDLRSWHDLQARLLEIAGGFTGPETCRGAWKDENARVIVDASHAYRVALDPHRVPELRSLLVQATEQFDQKAIYLAVGSRVEFVRAGRWRSDRASARSQVAPRTRMRVPKRRAR